MFRKVRSGLALSAATLAMAALALVSIAGPASTAANRNPDGLFKCGGDGACLVQSDANSSIQGQTDSSLLNSSLDIEY